MITRNKIGMASIQAKDNKKEIHICYVIGYHKCRFFKLVVFVGITEKGANRPFDQRIQDPEYFLMPYAFIHINHLHFFLISII